VLLVLVYTLQRAISIPSPVILAQIQSWCLRWVTTHPMATRGREISLLVWIFNFSVMIKRILLYSIAAISLFMASCGKEFLTVRPIEDLTGNNYWQTKNDAEMFVRGLYSNFRHATMDHAFFTSTGDFRCAPINGTPGSNGAGEFMNHLRYLRANNLDGLFAQYFGTSRGYGVNDDY